MASILFYPEFPTESALADQVFRCVWHFLPMREHLNSIIFLRPANSGSSAFQNINGLLDEASQFLSPDMDPAICLYAPSFKGKVELRPNLGESLRIPDLKGILVWDTSDSGVVAAAQALGRERGADVLLVDPNRVQQETLETIRFAYSLWSQEELSKLVEQSYAAFLNLRDRWRGKKIDVFGNGPSLGRVVKDKISLDGDARAVCNSTLGDTEALNYLKPELLFCGDPVQHCGASLYGGKFRQDLAKALQDENRVLFTQLGYVPYFRAVTDPDVHDRIIGIGNDRRPAFNIDLTEEFLTAATANIFTMLVLPVAITLFRSVDIYGCDGMPFSKATKPWTHSGESDYMSKMSVTHRVHKGFWHRNYEEEYWAYCRDMSELLSAAKAAGCEVRNRTPSFVPALAARYQP
jgi:hypothetical protein